MKTLVKKAKSGDGNAFAQLIKDNENTLYRIARSYLKNEADIADAVQETILSVWENLSQLREPNYFKTWMIRILINQCYRMIRERNREISFEQVPEAHSSQFDTGNLEFEDMLDCLSDNNRVVLTLFYGEELTIKEIAKILELSEAAIKQRLHRGRQEIRERYFSMENPGTGRKDRGSGSSPDQEGRTAQNPSLMKIASQE